jgi:hypothetical protein
MKRVFFRLMILAALILGLGACESLPFNHYLSRTWAAPGKAAGALPVRVRLVSVSVDRTGGWASVEKEIRGLAPLLFFDRGCRLVPPEAEADFCADIRAREREYAAGWQTKRSLALEVRLWPAGAPEEPALPLAAGRVTSLGSRSFSSSETTGRMLALAIKKAVRPLKGKAFSAEKAKTAKAR